MPGNDIVLFVVAALVAGVLIAGPLQSLWGWLLQTTGRLLLVAAILTLLWLFVKSTSQPTPASDQATAWWE